MGRNDIRTLHVPIAPPLPPVELPEPPEPPAAVTETQAGPALALEQFLGTSARRSASSTAQGSAELSARQASPSSCPQCQAVLSRVEQRMGRCLSCGQPLQAPGGEGAAEQRPGFTVGI